MGMHGCRDSSRWCAVASVRNATAGRALVVALTVITRGRTVAITLFASLSLARATRRADESHYSTIVLALEFFFIRSARIKQSVQPTILFAT